MTELISNKKALACLCLLLLTVLGAFGGVMIRGLFVHSEEIKSLLRSEAKTKAELTSFNRRLERLEDR